ncbi:MAG TPA: EAL domain-containing protein [Kineosporiaceae bacterium]|nr:EAL domain-containing protein [Kineosporiaceae bacterium]
MTSTVRRLRLLAWLQRTATVLMSVETVFVLVQSITSSDPLPDAFDVLICVVALGSLLVLTSSGIAGGRLTRLLSGDAKDLAARRQQELAAADRRQRRYERIENALDGNAYPTMVFQPIVDLDTANILGYEALARFGPGEAPPDVWFRHAASVGLGIELELKAVRRALEQLPELPHQHQYISVNASPELVLSNDLHDLIARHDAARIVVELTEHPAVDDYQSYRTAIERLRGLGAKLAIDDLGAGYAAMRNVIELRPDILKIDRTLIIEADESAVSIVQALVTLAGMTGATVLAEGIEDETVLHRVQALGVDLGQGWHFGRPGPLPSNSTGISTISSQI